MKLSPTAIKVTVALALFFSQAFFAGFSVVGKLGVDAVSPIVFAFMREGLAGPILLTSAVLIERSRPELRDVGWFFGLGILGIFGNQLCFLMGLKFANSIIASIMQPAIPVVTTVLSLILRFEKPTILKLLGIFFAVGGAVFMVAFELGTAPTTEGSRMAIGIALFVGNTFCSGVYILMLKPVLKKYPPLTVTAVAYMIASIFMGVALLIFAAVSTESIWNFDMKRVAIPLAYSIVFPTVLAYTLVSYASTHTDASIVSAANTLQPLLATILAVIFLHEELTWRHGVGAALIIAGLGCVTFQQWRESKAKKAAEEQSLLEQNTGNGDQNSDGVVDHEDSEESSVL